MYDDKIYNDQTNLSIYCNSITMNVFTEHTLLGNYSYSDIVHLKFMQPDVHKDKKNYIFHSYLQHKKMKANEILNLYIFLSYKNSKDEYHRKHFYQMFNRTSIIPLAYFKQFLDVYCEYTRFLNRLVRFVSRVKMRVVKKYDIDSDLCLNKFECMSENKKLSIIENNTLFQFSIYDLVKVFKMSLMNSGHLLILPQMPKNPYTNLKFSYKNLVKISNMLKKYYYTPAFIHSFIELGFDIDRFSYYNQQYLIDNCVNIYIDELDARTLFSTLVVLFKTYTRYVLITAFSDTIIKQNMKSLHLHYKMEYIELNNMSSEYTQLYKQNIHSRLINFVLSNRDLFTISVIKRKFSKKREEQKYEDEDEDEDSTDSDDNTDSDF